MIRIGIVVINFPITSETFILTKVIGLIENNFDVCIFSSNKSKNWEKFNLTKNQIENLKKRIILSPLAYRKNYVVFIFYSIYLFINKFFFHPKKVVNVFFDELKFSKLHGTSLMSNFLHKLIFVGEKLDIIHIEFDFQAFGLMNLKKICGGKLVLSGRGSINRTSIPYRYEYFYREIYEKVDYYHFISLYLYKEAVNKGLSVEKPWKLIMPAIDLSLFSPKKIKNQDSKIIITTVARLSWAKGYEFMIDAIAKVYQKYQNIKYLIVGDGEYIEAIKYAAYQNDLIKNNVVEFVGSVSRSEVNVYLNMTDIFLLASLDEGFCNAVIEAQAMEIPVICSDAGGLPENIEHNVTGFIVPRRDSDAIADKIIFLIENPDLRLKMGKAGRIRALTYFDLKQQNKLFFDLYNEVLSI
ncbi:glycosyltransferase family 4 protein [Thermaurantimonas aggregans]|uniref:glycosyltransferase family 4 protein n=1 Tax=Thermaurantimonas aggregans TaxID=2173829 RepID=UPI0023F1F636|nr:glycosyltransferase family 4 protein [Thermaurantimonas aggregans]MCX8148583.1 glycosyltransferase family 4 protein [Thermaurantimonas aggregans]